ncbi:uncharacterized protein EV154DRAFT_510918 [Mucor mucedo]|uniref:uncharacterized protein n=1 Tax=Mucor mucedo TaxID=29922 RepID=UPI00222091D8|nr:uncharacterized protein EV154DRAFT_510918 [Mucor mucedo]KAI7890597.1 hypothetical protein EV154DRAFT_510918 [Mucor mucedo]
MPSRIQLQVTNVDYKRQDPVFWIEVKTTLTKYKQKQKRFPRYYSELSKLHDHLASTLDDVLIPALPTCPTPRLDKEGKLVGRQWWLSIKLPHESSSEKVDAGLVENKIQDWLDRVSEHERVQDSEGLREFVESEVAKFRPTSNNFKSRNKLPLINVSEEDMEPEFEYCMKELTTFSSNLSQIIARLEKLVNEENEMSICWMNLSSSWVSYGGIERNPGLFILYKSVAKGYQQLSDLERFQAIALNETIGDEILYQTRNCNSAQNAMQRRLNALSDYLTSRKITESSLKSVERLKSSTIIDRQQASEAIAILENARTNQNANKDRFNKVDTNLRNDIEENYRPNVKKDMLRAIKEFAKSQLYLEKKKLLIFQEILENKKM